MPTVHNYTELEYLIRTGINKLPQLIHFNVFAKTHSNSNIIIVTIDKKVKDEYIKEVIEEIMENEFSATPIEDNKESGYTLSIVPIEDSGTQIVLCIPDYIHEYLEQNNGEWS